MTHDISYGKFTCGFSEENLMKNTTTENKRVSWPVVVRLD